MITVIFLFIFLDTIVLIEIIHGKTNKHFFLSNHSLSVNIR